MPIIIIINVFPKFLCFQLPNVARQDVISIRKHLLKSAIAKRSKEYRRLLLARDKLSTQIRDVLSSFDFYILQKALNRNVHQAEAKVIETHTRKLEKLTRNTVLPFTANETVTNISSCCLTSEQLDMLKFSLTHSICPPSISKTDVFTCFELIHQLVMISNQILSYVSPVLKHHNCGWSRVQKTLISSTDTSICFLSFVLYVSCKKIISAFCF